MARAIWSGSISFGLLNVPVKLYSAVSRRQISFRELRESDSSRVRHKRVAEADGEEVAYEEIVKGYELAPEQYVIFSRDELEELDPKKTKAIEVEAFVDLDDIDPIYFVQPYYLGPEPGAERAYALLVKAMADERKVAISRFVLRNKEHLAALRPMGDVLTLTTMRFADEIVPPAELDGVVPDDVESPKKKELDMAKQLVGSLTSDFDPDEFHDEYREELLARIEAKAQGEDVVQAVSEEPTPTKAPDLMAALEESLAAVKGEPLGAGSKAKSKPAAKRKSSSTSGSNGGKSTASKSKAKSSSKTTSKSRSRSKAKAAK
ncbi:MAG: Ku protein [Solirubrobacterales bacterium]|jgi:DNA end-binding protein Ku